MAHWVTINGNHVLIDDDGSSLSDPSYNDDDDEIDSLMTKEEMDAMFRESAEAMNRGINVDEFRAEKLGIDPDELSVLEEMRPDLQKMSANEIKDMLYKWWFKQTKGDFWAITPTIMELADIYNEEKFKNKNYSFQGNFSPFKALYYYVKGNGETRTIHIKDVNITGEEIAKSDYVQDYLKRNPNASTIPLNGEKIGIDLTNYPENAFLGNIDIRPLGVLYRKNGKFLYRGDVKSYWDIYDFHDDVWRKWLAKFSGKMGKYIPGKPYQIAIDGKKHIDELNEH